MGTDFDKPLTAASAAGTDLPSQAIADSSLSPTPTASTDDRLSHYQEGRSDVRAYASLLIQVITVLLSTMIVVMGWIAKDYATEKYHVALQAVAPALANPPTAVPGLHTNPQVPLTPQSLAGIEHQLDNVSVVYLHLLYNSPTTSLLLFGAAFFTLLLFGVLLTLTYQLQRRRYFYHGLGRSIGLDPDQPVVELIDGALNLFLIIIGLVATGLVTLAFVQICYYCVRTPSNIVRYFLVFALFILGLKFWSIAKATVSYARFDRKEGWKARWLRALVLIGEIERTAYGHADCDPRLQKTMKDIQDICSQGGKDRWRTAQSSLTDLIHGLRGTTLGNTVREQAEDLVMTLRYPELLKQWKA